MQQADFQIPSLGSVGEMLVYDFAGEEALSQLFSFEVVAATVDTQVDLDEIVQQKVILTLDVTTQGSGHTTRKFYGIVTAATDWGEAHGDRYLFFYRMTVKPLFWLMTLHRRSRVFRSKTVPDVVQAVFEDNGFGSSDIRFDLRAEYPVRDFTVQYDESDWAFVSRLLEDEGIFFYFIPEGDREVLVATDVNPEQGGPLDLGEVALLSRVSMPTDLVHMTSFTARSRMTPDVVRYLDRDYEDFPTGHAVTETTPEEGDPLRHGVVEEYDELMRATRPQTGWSGEAPDVESEQDAPRQERLRLRARRRREEIMANQGTHFFGTSNQSLFGHGCVFELTRSRRYANKYLILRVRHVGSQRAQFMGFNFDHMPAEGFGAAFDGLFQAIRSGGGEEGGSRQGGYTNSATCIELARPYRPARTTPVPRIPGLMSGKIEAHPGDKLLDPEGHYLVRLFFDEQGPFATEPNEASRPVRRMQISGGRDWGTHLPSELGTESLVAFLNGNPDEPVLLGNLPNMATHTPVPNTALGLGSENPDEQRWNDDRISYDEKKHVVRSATGHQLVMDDDTGRANVGVTLQAGITPSDGEEPAPDVYWGSKLELGGFRQKGAVETDGDRKTQGLDNLEAPGLTPGPLPGMVRQAVQDTAYWEDATSDVTPVGAHLYTHNRAEVVARNGIDLCASNAPGVAGTSRLDVDQNRGVMATVGKFVRSTLWRAVLKRGERLVDVLKDAPGELSSAYDGQPILERPATHIWKKAEALLKAKVYEALRLPGITINATGPVTTTSFTSVDTVAGEGGYHVESFGDLTQRTEYDAALEAGQLVRIRTRGVRQTERDLPKAAAEKSASLADARSAVQAAVDAVGDVVTGVYGQEDPVDETFPVLLQNEHGGIVLHTEGKGKGEGDPGHIEQFAAEGDVRARVRRDGKIAAHAEKEITMIVEQRASSGVLEDFYDGELAARSLDGTSSKVVLTPENAETYAKEFIRLQTNKDAKGDKMAPSIQIEKDESITLQCGQSMIRMKKDGTIDIEGVNINIKAKQDVSVEGLNITEKAQVELKEEATMIKSKATATYDLQGTMTTIKGDAMLTEKGGVVMIN